MLYMGGGFTQKEVEPMKAWLKKTLLEAGKNEDELVLFKEFQESFEDDYNAVQFLVEDEVCKALEELEADGLFDGWKESRGWIEEDDLESRIRRIVSKEYSADPRCEDLVEYGLGFCASCIVRLYNEPKLKAADLY